MGDFRLLDFVEPLLVVGKEIFALTISYKPADLLDFKV